MAGIAQIAKSAGHDVTGSDLNVYPPMSTQLEQSGITLKTGYEPEYIDSSIDCVIVGNVIKRGNLAMEYIMQKRIPYFSGPEWLANHILHKRHVIAVSGTHGKTTTTSLVTWILEYANKIPGFLIGGVPENFGISARIGADPYFVIEADEYDSAFFDKRSKFLHYRPQTLILNNLEFDHADIFPDVNAIEQQFHYLVRQVPGNGLIVHHGKDCHLKSVLGKGCWTPLASFGSSDTDWSYRLLQQDGSHFVVIHKGQELGEVRWDLLGLHNVNNALAAIAAASNAEVPVSKALEALPLFKNVKRRLEVRGMKQGITFYDDFAHHPTAIATTLAGLRAKVGASRIIAILEFGSYTMKSGVHKNTIRQALQDADLVICKRPDNQSWDLGEVLKEFTQPTFLFDNVENLVRDMTHEFKQGDHVVVMSNSGFGGIHQKLLDAV